MPHHCVKRIDGAEGHYRRSGRADESTPFHHVSTRSKGDLPRGNLAAAIVDRSERQTTWVVKAFIDYFRWDGNIRDG